MTLPQRFFNWLLWKTYKGDDCWYDGLVSAGYVLSYQIEYEDDPGVLWRLVWRQMFDV